MLMQIEPMAFTTALYYPAVEISNNQWASTAVLYWEELRTIVPRDVETPYKSTTSRTLFDAGVLKRLVVKSDDAEVLAIVHDASGYLNSPEDASVIFDRHPYQFDLDELPDAVRQWIQINSEALPETHPARSVLRNSESATKIAELRSHLDFQRAAWLTPSSRLSIFYMTLLAARLAERHGFGLLTSSSGVDRLALRSRTGVNGLTSSHGKGPSSRLFAEGTLAELILKTVSVAPDTSLKRLLTFRHKHADELARFRSAIGKLVSSVDETSLPIAERNLANSSACLWRKVSSRFSEVSGATDTVFKINSASVPSANSLLDGPLPCEDVSPLTPVRDRRASRSTPLDDVNRPNP